MIANDTELLGALQQISWAADALEGIRLGTTSDNVALFPALAESYLNHIREHVSEAQSYAADRRDRPQKRVRSLEGAKKPRLSGTGKREHIGAGGRRP